MLPQQVNYLGEINNVVQKCAFSFLKLSINKGFGEIKCQSQDKVNNLILLPAFEDMFLFKNFQLFTVNLLAEHDKKNLSTKSKENQ